jgi:precorrin-2 dehydrogenase/sirohydrochlorin ferrochelatase
VTREDRREYAEAMPSTVRPCVCRRELASCDHSCSRDLLDVSYFTPCLNLTDRPCLVVGAGPVGLEKVEGLLAANAAVTVVAPEAVEEIEELAAEGALRWEPREYRSDDLEGKLLVFIATADTALNVRIFREAEQRVMLVNVVDVPPLCNFIMPAVVRRGAITVAISTSGASPALAKRLKREIAEHFGEPYARLADLLNDIRPWAKDTFATYQERKLFFEDLVNGDPDPVALIAAGEEQAARELVAERMRAAEAALAT